MATRWSNVDRIGTWTEDANEPGEHISATRCAVVDKVRDSENDDVDARRLRELARMVGVELGEERSSTLVAQAIPHFAMLRQLDKLAVSTSEPAAEFRLDGWTRSSNG